MRPLWKLSDLKQMHAGQNNWPEQIILDPEQDATYNSAAPGTKFDARMHPDTPTVFVVVAGEVHFNVEGQPPATARRGSIVNIMKTTIFSYDVAGDQNALWVEVNPTNYKTVYPADGPPPPPSKDAKVVKVAFNHNPDAYTEAEPARMEHLRRWHRQMRRQGAVVVDDHLFVDPLLGYRQSRRQQMRHRHAQYRQRPGSPTPTPSIRISTFGHMHPGPAEWWIVQVGAIRGKFENAGRVPRRRRRRALCRADELAPDGRRSPVRARRLRLAMGGYQPHQHE